MDPEPLDESSPTVPPGVAAAPDGEVPAPPAGGALEAPAVPVAPTDEITAADIDAVDAELDEVEQALARIDDGSYGRCEACGTLIDDAVLGASPTARRCGTCPPSAMDQGSEAESGTPITA